MLSAKATFSFDLNGRVELETQEPMPLLMKDEPTPFGLLPSDFEARRDKLFEVILLGQAHARPGEPVESLLTELAVGDERRQLVVTGDRTWVQNGQSSFPTRPVPFQSMPLVYERAFGGTQVAWIDALSEMDLFDPVNPNGRGFDAQQWARGVGEMLRAPAGFPRIDNYRRTLPNLEDPRHRIERWEDAPDPACWATTPPNVTIHAVRRARTMRREEAESSLKMAHTADSPASVDLNEGLYRAHPDWLIAIPRFAPHIRLSRLVAGCEHLVLRLPDERIVADYVVSGRSGTRALLPQRLVLLPEERRLSLLYRSAFTFGFDAGDERAFRLRVEPGWFSGESPA
jgi:hypothetical protein